MWVWGWPSADYVWIWAGAAVLVYNVDRLRNDPADAVNVPKRQATTERHRLASMTLAAAGALAILLLPMLRRDWLLLGMTLGGGAICMGYSLPINGLRLKDLPVLKTLFAPTALLLAWLLPPLIRFGPAVPTIYITASAAWTWTLLLFNMVLCDQRDLKGDRLTGIISLPIALGQRHTRRLLAALIIANAALGLGVFALFSPVEQRQFWLWLGSLAPLAMTLLLVALRKPRGEFFYEWAVEGLLLLPLLARLLAW